MQIIRYQFKHRALIAVILGLIALVLNLISARYSPNIFLHIGDIILYLVASGFSPLLVLVAILVTEIPLMLTKAHSVPFGVINSVFLVTFSYLVNRFPNFPVFITFTLLWIVVEGFLILITDVNNNLIYFNFCAGLTLFGLSRLLLLITPVANFIYGKLYRLRFEQLIPEILSIFLIATVGLVFFQSHENKFIVEYLISNFGVAIPGFFALISVITPTVGIMLNSTIFSEYETDVKYYLKKSNKPVEFNLIKKGSLFSKKILQKNFYKPKQKKEEKAIVVVNGQDNISFISGSAINLIGLKTPNLLGNSINCLFNNEDTTKKIVQFINSARKGGQFTEEIRIQGDDEFSHKFYRLIFTPNSDCNVAIEDTTDVSNSEVIITIEDITSKRILGKGILESKRRENLGYITAEISRAFSDALTGIQSLSGMGLKAKNLEEKDEALGLVLQISESAELLVQQLISFSDNTYATRKVESINKIIEERLEFFKKSIGDSCVIELHLTSENTDANINTPLMVQALSHLFINAKESYLDQGGSIAIFTDIEEIDDEVANLQPGLYSGKYVRIRIKDYGMGMSTENLNRAFDPFFTTKTGHSGIGLSIVFGVIRSHDGFLTAESTLGKGTTVTLYLPKFVQEKM